ncbi:hypothetical protein EBZ39_07520 [bacterium]|nr:hypothetical protein [bacterium]
MALADLRLSILDTLNTVRRKLGVNNAATSLTQDAQVVLMMDYLDDVIKEIDDYGMWPEMLNTTNTTIVAGVYDYSVNTTDAVKTIKDIYYGPNRILMNQVSIEDMRLLQRNLNTTGSPRQYALFGVDSIGNPIIRVNPTPATTEDGYVMDVLWQRIPTRYTTASDTSTIIPFNSTLVCQGLLCRMILDEEGGSQSDHYTKEREKFVAMLRDQFNRHKLDAGYWRKFSPNSAIYRRRG